MLEKVGKIIYFSQTRADFAEMIVQDQVTNKMDTILVNNPQSVIDGFNEPSIVTIGDCKGGTVIGDWRVHQEGDKKPLEPTHPAIVQGVPVDSKVIRKGKEIILKKGEFAEIGDIWVYGPNPTKRASFVGYPKFIAEIPQVEKAIKMAELGQRKADLVVAQQQKSVLKSAFAAQMAAELAADMPES